MYWRKEWRKRKGGGEKWCRAHVEVGLGGLQRGVSGQLWMWQSWDNGALGVFMWSEKPNVFNRTGEAVFSKSQRRVSLTFFLPQLFLVFLLHLIAKPWKTCLYSLSPAPLLHYFLNLHPSGWWHPYPFPHSLSPVGLNPRVNSQSSFYSTSQEPLTQLAKHIDKHFSMSYPRMWASEQWRLGKEMHK